MLSYVLVLLCMPVGHTLRKQTVGLHVDFFSVYKFILEINASDHSDFKWTHSSRTENFIVSTRTTKPLIDDVNAPFLFRSNIFLLDNASSQCL